MIERLARPVDLRSLGAFRVPAGGFTPLRRAPVLNLRLDPRSLRGVELLL